MDILVYTEENLKKKIHDCSMVKEMSEKTGLSRMTIARAYRENANPMMHTLLKICLVLNCRLAINTEGKYLIEYNEASIKDQMDRYSRKNRSLQFNLRKIAKKAGIITSTVKRALYTPEQVDVATFQDICKIFDVTFILDPVVILNRETKS